jgi:hypothetical protein
MFKDSILIYAIALASINVCAQTPKQFDDVDKYPETVEMMFRTIKSTEGDRALLAEFSGMWSGGVFSEDERMQIIRLSDAFLAKKARNIHYYGLWRCLLLFKESANSAKGYDAWMKALIRIVGERRATPAVIHGLTTATGMLLSSNILCSTQGNEWRMNGSDYTFAEADSGLFVVCGNVDLLCFSKGDSIMIGQTAGKYDMTQQLWKGRGGVVTWERAGFAAADVFAVLGDYGIDMKKSQYEADSVTFTHKTYFPDPVYGTLIDRVRHNQSPETAIYPEFRTSGERYIFENIYPDISYEGGVVIQGARTTGFGTDETKALLRIKSNDSLHFTIRSKNFTFRSDRINAGNASPVIYLGDDSIRHTHLSFVYIVPTREVGFLRSDAASSQASYNNSYHKMDMNFEQLIWKIDEPVMSFSMTRGSSVGRAEFRSQDYFNRVQYEQMQYFDREHPLVLLKKCAETFGTDEFPVEAYTSFLKRSIADTRRQIINLAKQGYVIYDGDNDYITIQPLLYATLRSAAKQKDFDVINLNSLVNAPVKNATMDVSTYDLKVFGVEQFVVSDSQRVVITPTDQMLILKKNRAMDINGRVDAGQLTFYGDSMYFDYDTFKINLYRADSLIMFVPSDEKDLLGRATMVKIKNAVEKVSGEILVDRPDNKSGRFSLHEYPILHSDSVSYVRYGSSSIEKGAYDNEAFFFELNPFVMDSLEHFSKEQLILPGRFSSANIFADMNQTLTVQPDYSLGFKHETGDSGIETYSNARLRANISLSNKGLKASGQLDFLTATIHTDEFKLYPDSTNIPVAKDFILRKQTTGVEFPEIHSAGNRIHWEPQNDKMFIYKSDKTLRIYTDDTQFDGNALLTSGGLSGKGRMDMGIVDIRSDSIAFHADAFHADASLFRLRMAKDGAYQMVTADTVSAQVDFIAKNGQFESLKDYGLVRFPANNFAAYVNDFTWDMSKVSVTMGGDTLAHPLKEAVDFKYKSQGENNGMRFYSTLRSADSLNFVATSAVFDYTSGQIHAEGVKLLQSADALVYPAGGKLKISNKGLLELSDSARIVFSDTLQQHVIHSARVNVSGRKTFTGSGKYDYTDETGKITVIDIPHVSSEKSGITTASGEAGKGEDDEFKLNPFYRFQGKLLLSSENRYPEFDGTAQIVQECEALRPDWFRFKAEINPAEVQIQVSEAPVNKQNAKIYNGIFLMSSDSVHIYPAFFSKRKNYSDNPLIQAHGMLSYNRDSMIYYIAPEGKLKNPDTTGNILAFSREACTLRGEGRISLGIDLGQVKTDAVGRIAHNLNTHETLLDVLLAVDFLFDANLAATIAGKMDSLPTLTGVDMNRQTYIRGMNEWLGVTEASRFRREASIGEVRNFPAQLNHTLLLTHLKMQWNQARRSYRSTGKIGIGNIFGNQINRMVDGLVELSKRPGGDVLDIYLKADDNTWIYFGYTRELMQIVSSSAEWNERLAKLPEKQRKSDDRRPGYTYMIASSDKLTQFLAQMNRMEMQEQPQDQAYPVPQETQPEEPQTAPIVEIE